MIHVSIIDLGLNNISSLLRCLSSCDSEAEISIVTNYESKKFSHIVILPGIGNFGTACDVMMENGIDYFLTEQAELGSFILGICLGMQLLGTYSSESPNAIGLGLIEGESSKFVATNGFPVPHVGWNSIEIAKPRVLDSLSSGSDFYFTHSFFFEPKNPSSVLANTSYADTKFVSAVQKENIFGFQFHPEKSGSAGEKLIAELLEKAKNEI